MTEIVKREIDELRGYVNLKDCQKTMNKACDKKYYELVTYIANHRENYEKYIKENSWVGKLPQLFKCHDIMKKRRWN